MNGFLSLFGSAVVGIVAAWLAGHLLRGNGFGLLGNIVAGILGAVAGGYLLRVGGLDFGGGLPGRLVVSFLGAAIALFAVHAITGRRGGHRSWS